MMRRALLVLALAAASAVSGAAPAAAAEHDLQFSTSATRSSPQPLAGATVAGTVYIVAAPGTGTAARFWLDDPARAGAPRTTERNAPWDFAGGNSDGTARPFDTRTISNGTHTVTVAVTRSDGSLSISSATFTVTNGTTPPPPPPSDYVLQKSASADRSSPTALASSTVSGTIYVFAKPDTGTGARFWLDDPSMAGTPRMIENGAPWDFAGGNSSTGTAKPFDTRTLPDGLHTISVAVSQASGPAAVAHAQFTVANTSSTPALGFDRPSTAFAVQPGASPPSQTVLLSAGDGRTPSFAVTDDASWLTVSPGTGTVPASLTLTVASSALPAGTYQGKVTASAAGYQSATLNVTLSVQAAGPPDQIHLAWVEDSATTMTVTWHTGSTATPSTVQWRAAGAADWQSTTGSLRPSGTAGTLHETTLRSLAPATTYQYRVLGDGGLWSPIFATRTAPAAGPATFDAVYVADTGLIGRADGLASGTEAVLAKIAELDPLLVLGGGDYAYFNTDKRFGTLEATIDAWFNQMQPLASRAPLMPTYGNHEAILGEGFSNWAARLPTPTGFDARRNFSFDVGDTHFVSIFAVNETIGLSSGTLAWIESDINDARARGKRWIIPFFHVSPFADGSSHPSNLALRGQLGPLFERLDVPVAIASHDQSYERTYPLQDVPSTNTPTSASRRCYSPASDGVSWVKVSPGGKESSKNGSFSAFQTFPAPAYIAFRDDTTHHFARIRVTAAGVLRIENWAVERSGASYLQDWFEYRTAGCPPALEFSRVESQLRAAAGGSATAQVQLSAGGAAVPASSVSDDAPWLSVSPASGAAPRSLTLTANATGLAPGKHTATVTATASGFAAATLVVTLEVTEAHRLLVSTSPTRSAPVPLDGAVLSGTRYVFVSPSAGATGVRFWLDDPGMAGTPKTIEGNAPWDFLGSASDGTAKPWSTGGVATGTHTITARVALPDGGVTVASSTFTVVR